MSVLIETSLGGITIDLFWKSSPLTCKNFLALCHTKYYNGCLLYHTEADYRCYTGDPTGTGQGGESVYAQLYGPQAALFHEKPDRAVAVEQLEAGQRGVFMREGRGGVGSSFFISLREERGGERGEDTAEFPFGVIVDGFDTVRAINELFVDESYRPLVDIRMKHAFILVDPFNVEKLCSGLSCESPKRLKPLLETVPERLSVEEAAAAAADAGDVKQELEALERIADQEAHNRAVMLEIIGDLPDADMAPPENVLFVCKLNPVTTSEDLEILFARFGDIKSCNIIRDWKTGDSLCYGFVEFTSKDACERAYFKMNGVLVDDRRIRVDFSQSVSRLWAQFRQHGSRQRREDNIGASDGKQIRPTHANAHPRQDRRPIAPGTRMDGPGGDSNFGMRQAAPERPRSRDERERRDPRDTLDNRTNDRTHDRIRRRSRSRSRDRSFRDLRQERAPRNRSKTPERHSDRDRKHDHRRRSISPVEKHRRRSSSSRSRERGLGRHERSHRRDDECTRRSRSRSRERRSDGNRSRREDGRARR